MRLYWIETPCGRLATAPAPSGSSLDREIGDLLEAEVGIVEVNVQWGKEDIGHPRACPRGHEKIASQRIGV